MQAAHDFPDYSLKEVRTLVLAGPEENFPMVLRAASSVVFPNAAFILTGSLPASLAKAEEMSGGGAGLILAAGNSKTIKRNKIKLPAGWELLGIEPGQGIWPMEDVPVPLWAQALGNEASRIFLEEENARLRGILLTVSRRVSHDLRTPLGGVFATMDLLAELVPDGRSAVSPLLSSVEEITRIIDRTSFLLKAIARPLPKKTVSMAHAVQEAVMRLENPITRKAAALQQPDTWPDVQGVRAWLEVIWWNLLHNALIHSGAHPEIELSWQRMEEGWRFSIRDKGPGVPPGLIANLFRPFHELHEPDSPRGLGLSIVHTLVTLQGGTCGYERVSNGGSRLHFTLPEKLDGIAGQP